MQSRTLAVPVPAQEDAETAATNSGVNDFFGKRGVLRKAVLDNFHFSIIATDERGIIQVFNSGAEKMLGYSGEEAIDKITLVGVLDSAELIARAAMLSEEYSTSITPGFEALVFKADHEITDIYDMTWFRKDGSRLSATISITALRTGQGSISGYLLFLNDNTARNVAKAKSVPAAEHRLDAQENFQLMVESVTDCAIIMLDEEGRVKTWNLGAQRIKGYEAAEIIGQPISRFSIPEDVAAQKPERSLREAASTGRFEDYGWRVRKDGTRFWGHTVITAIRDSGGKLLGFAKLARDMTEQKSADDALRESEARLRSILDTVPDAIVIVDEQGVIESFSPAASRLFGYTPVQVTGRNVKMLMPPSDRDRHDGYLSRYLRTGEKRIIGTGRLVAGMRRDGSTFPVELAVGEAQRGKRTSFTGFFRDMTERQKVEAELIEARATAEAANKAKSEFLSSMSHELRTPLNAILGFAQLMASDTPKPTSGQTTSIDQILQAGWYLLTLINEVLDLSLIESGKLTLSPEPVSAADILSHCKSMMEPIAQKRGIEMTFPSFDTECFVLADRTRLRQVLVNLLSNAIKYNRPNGRIVVDCAARPKGHVRLSVQDTGAGLTPEKISQLFQPFNRLGQEAGTEQGTGIGLVVTKRLVEAMQGTVGVESQVGSGTVFWVDLLETVPSQVRTTHANPRAGSTTHVNDKIPVRTVLYVEDNPANLKLVEMLISRRQDLRLLSARTGDLGIELAQTYRPDVILMDIHLPGTNGVTAMTILRQDPKTAHIPIIALSANANPRDVERGLAAGFLRYLTKPINVDELLETLELALVPPTAAPPLNPKAA